MSRDHFFNQPYTRSSTNNLSRNSLGLVQHLAISLLLA